MNKDYNESIIASARRALSGQIPTSMRQYSFSFDENNRTITFKAEVSLALTEDEQENLAVIETQIYADMDHDIQIKTIVEIVNSNKALNPLKSGIIYSA